jgi:hypothetical protein
MRGSVSRIWRTEAGKTPFPRSGSKSARGISSSTTTTCRPRTGARPICSTRRESPSPRVAREIKQGNDAAVPALQRVIGGVMAAGMTRSSTRSRPPCSSSKISQLCNCEQYCTFGWRRIAFNQPALRMASAARRPDPGFPPSPRPGVSPQPPRPRGPLAAAIRRTRI